MPKLLLIQPSLYDSHSGVVCKGNRLNLPGLALPLIAGLTPKHWDVKIIIEYIEDINFDEECDIVGIGNMGHSVLRGNDIAKEFMKRGKLVFVGGMMSTMLPEIVDGCADSIVIGDAEISYIKLLHDFETTGKIQKIYNNPVQSLNNLPLPRYDLLVEKKIGAMLPVQIGRGCPNTCNFCSVSCLYEGKYLTRDIQEVIRDVKEVKRLGFNYILFVDDNIIGKPAYFKELAKQLIPLKIKWVSQAAITIAYDDEMLQLAKQSGCKLLGIGIESISQESLKSLNKQWIKSAELASNIKKINNAGIMIQSDMIIGTDADTVESLKMMCQFIKEHKLSVPTISILTPVPGTKYYKKMQEEHRLLHSDLSKYIGTHCVHKPALLSPKEVEHMLWYIYKELYSIPAILKRVFINKMIFKDLFWSMIILNCNLTYRKNTRKKNSSVIF